MTWEVGDCPPFHVISHALSGSHLPPTCTCDCLSVHTQAVTTLPHAHTLRQSPPIHMHTLSGSHHPPTCTHSGSHHPPTCIHSGSHHPSMSCPHTLRQSPPSHMHTLSVAACECVGMWEGGDCLRVCACTIT